MLYLDTETRCDVPIGAMDKYVRACEPIIATWAFDDEPVDIAPYLQGWGQIGLTDRVLDYLQKGSLSDTIVAHNAVFDYGVVTYGLQIETDIQRWRCTRAQAYAHGLPGSLELLGDVLAIPFTDRKSGEGHRLIQTFCIPYTESPEGQPVYYTPAERPDDWLRFCDYAKQDTAALRAVHRKLPTHNYRGESLALWHLDQLCNWRGFRFDRQLATAARSLLEKAKVIHGHEISAATGGEVGAATQRKRLLEYLNRRYGAELQNLRAATVREMLDQDDIEPGLRFLLEARLEAAKSSGAKFGRGLSLLGPQERLRHTHQFCGAGRTGRDSHKGFQPGNMARPTMAAEYIDEVIIPGVLSGAALDEPLLYGGPNTAGANALRGSIIAALGNELIDADFSNVESRVLAWLSVAHEALGRYRAGEDLYKAWYSEKFGIPIEEVTYEQRQIAKVVALSMGFLGGVGAFVPMAATYQLDLDTLPELVLPRASATQLAKAEKAWERAALSGDEGDFGLERDVYMSCNLLVQAYRTGNSEIFKVGHELGQAVIDAISEPGTAYDVARCRIWCSNTALLIQLPDGSRLTYFSPRVHTEKTVDPITGKESTRQYTSYMTARGMQWRRETAWAGLYWNNVTQGIANRLLRAAMLRIHADTLTVPAIAAYLARLPAHARTAIALRVHDSLTLDVPKGSYSLERMIEQMNILPAWAAGLPIATSGWVNPRFGKRNH
jgi:DNA polymerase